MVLVGAHSAETSAHHSSTKLTTEHSSAYHSSAKLTTEHSSARTTEHSSRGAAHHSSHGTTAHHGMPIPVADDRRSPRSKRKFAPCCSSSVPDFDGEIFLSSL